MKHLFLVALLFTATILSAQNVSYRYDAAGNRTERVITLGSPQKSPSEMTSIDDLVAEHELKIYPNPTRGRLTVELGSYSADIRAEFRLLDTSGRTVSRQKAESAAVSFDLSSHPKGMYLLVITINGEQATWKIIKE